jgi:hypothetical protein
MYLADQSPGEQALPSNRRTANPDDASTALSEAREARSEREADHREASVCSNGDRREP